MQSNTLSIERRGGRSRVSLYLLLGAGIGAAAALLFTPRKGSELRRLIGKKVQSDTSGPDTPSRTADKKENAPQASPPARKKVESIMLSKKLLISDSSVRRRVSKAASRPEMRISEQRYRIAHSGRRPSNIL